MSVFVTRRGALRATGALLAVGSVGGCSGDGGTATPTPTPEFGIEEFVYASEQPNSFGNYDRQPDATYSTGDVVWLYLDVVGFEVEEVDEDQVRIDIHENLVVTAPTGETALDNGFDLENTVDANLREAYYVTNNLSFPSGSPTGEYEAEVTLEDQIGGSTTARTETFTIE